MEKSNKMEKSKLTKRIILFLIFLAIFISGTVLMFTTPSSIKITYGLTTQSEGGVTIYFNVMEPKDDIYAMHNGDAKKKAIIIAHGYLANKEILKDYAIEMANAGFVAVVLDFRGHGQSTGTLDQSLLIYDVRAILAYLEGRGDIDMNNLGYLGYSMGGFPGWELVNEDNGFKCFIGLATGIPSPSNTPDYAIKVNSGRDFNVLMIMGKYDEVTTTEQLKEGMALRMGTSAGDVDINKLYGCFEKGTASMIYVDDNTNHLLVCWDQDCIRAARDWMISSFPTVRQLNENFYVNTRAGILVFQILGAMGIFFMSVRPLYSVLVKKKEETVEEMESSAFKIETPSVSAANLFLRSIIYSLVLGLVGIIIFMPLTFLLPLTTMAQVIMLLFGQTFALLILMWRVGKKENIAFKGILSGPFKRKNLLGEFVLGIILAAFIYVIVYLSIGLNYFAIVPSITKMIYVPLYLVIEFFILLGLNIFANATFQRKFKKGYGGLLEAGLLIFVMQIIYMAFYLFIVSLLQGNFFTFGVFLPVTIGVTLLGSYVSVVVYEKTGSIIPGTIAIIFIIVMLTTTVSIL